ncbi:MAG: methylornithine synthase PylB [Eggerthellaceae bacterium]|jgi:methylornithine synthase|nr:methylornithine synthase PylB [Eggerthellaceae bacterium]MCH4221657.1 methylornithine synthase PylB [Eggerthellaceae bacterium]
MVDTKLDLCSVAPSVEQIDDILKSRLDGGELSDEDVATLLTSENDDECRARIMRAAQDMRTHNFGTLIYLYGFVYYSTYCKNDCSFCYYRRSNTELPRYRKSIDETVEVAKRLAESGVNLIDLTMGEDPKFLDDPEALPALITKVKLATGLPIMVSPGLLDSKGIEQLAANGADWYALYQETYDKQRFEGLRIGQSAAKRLLAKRHAATSGLLIEEGLLCGLGESHEELLRSLQALRLIDAAQVRVMTFVPQSGTPLAHLPATTARRETLLIAIMRLMFPDRLIPASLDVEGLSGLRARLDAGANVVTSLIPPDSGLAGVANASADITNGYRTVAGVSETLEEAGLEAATPLDYVRWLEVAKWKRS